NPNLHSSLNYLEGQHFDRSAATSNHYNTNSKEYKTSRQKKNNQSQMRSNIAKKENDYKFSNNERQYNITKEKDLDNDGIPDRIDIDDTRNSVQTTSDLYEVGNRKDKTHIKTQKNINQAKTYKNASLKKEADKYQIGDKEDLSSLVDKEDKVVVRKTTQKKINQKKMKANFSFENDPEVKDKKSSSKKTFSKDQERKLSKNVQKKSMFGSPLTSQAVGKRTKTQKVLLAPTKAVSGVGASLKESLNKEIENSDMEGVRLANDIVSPLARKLRFESNSLIAKKVGFDRKAYNLSKVEKKIMKADKKAFKIKKAQRKNIRKKAVLNAKTVKGSKLDLVGRVRAITSLSATQIKDKILFALKRILTAIKSIKLLAGASSLILLAVIPFLILVPLFMLGGGFAITSADEQEVNLDFSASALSADVMQWEGKVVEELNKYGLVRYKDLVLVLITLESGGLLPDVMQSSESLGLPPNTLTDPNKSIEAGVKHLSEAISMMKKHKVDVQTLIQSYNYGTGFIPYVAKNGGILEECESI
ncbi:MAG: lysozyme family protein, partial [Weeksellaceae bacterium]|nr:lysozyme family protein [Weeksellaceae bacterium]